MAGKLLGIRDHRLTIAGEHDMAVQLPLWGKGREVRFWAERGLVCWEDSKDNSYGTMNHVEAGLRALALSEMVFKSHEQGYYCDETRRLQKFICEMENVIRKAIEQGSPLSEDAGREYVRRRPTSVIVPQEMECW